MSLNLSFCIPPAFLFILLPPQSSIKLSFTNLSPTHPSAHPSVNHPSSVYPQIHPSSVQLSIHLLSIHLSAPLPTHQFTHISIHIHIQPFASLRIQRSIRVPAYSFVNLPFHLPIHLPFHPSVDPSLDSPPIHLCGHPSASPSNLITQPHAANSISLSRTLQCYYDTSTIILGPRNPTGMSLAPYSPAYARANLS